MQKKPNKKLILIALSIVLVAAVAIGGTLAYLTDVQEKTNTFTIGDQDIVLDEPNYPDPEPTENVPGDSYPKDPTVHAVEGDSYIRLVVKFVDTSSGSVITDSALVAKIWQTIYYTNDISGAWWNGLGDGTNNLTANAGKKYSLAQLTTNSVPHTNASFTKDTVKSTTGTEYYNYNSGTPAGVLAEGAQATLFDAIIIPTEWNQTDLAILGNYKIVIQAQSIQAENFANAAEAFAALDAEIGGGTVQTTYGQVTMP
ncbi:MAG: SipW-dependent-type signal peptide-containing protein [Oscillospiraceae bacterium]|jgi:predicted ribosomally synthesized peptide with SipW-like signal peptide|nr:SipW-dependent-type signal peptide-containing protein [Oscillospiraceae bacterium]